MVKEGHKPELIVIAGPNGSGKTSVTKRFLHHEWQKLYYPTMMKCKFEIQN